MTTFARKGSTSIASHGKARVLHKSVSSPAAAAALNDVHELVSRLESRQPAAQPQAAFPNSSSSGCLVPLQHSSSSSPRQYVVHEDLVVDIRATGSSACDGSGTASGGSNSARSQRTTPISGTPISGAPGAWGAKTPIPDGPVYSALRQERAKAKAEDAAGGRSPSSPLSSSPRGACAAGPAAQDKKMQMMELSLEEVKTSNRLPCAAFKLLRTEARRTARGLAKQAKPCLLHGVGAVTRHDGFRSQPSAKCVQERAGLSSVLYNSSCIFTRFVCGRVFSSA